MIPRWLGRLCVALALLLVAAALFAQPAGITYDLVLTGGRAIDPASQLDGIRNLAIHGGRSRRSTSRTW